MSADFHEPVPREGQTKEDLNPDKGYYYADYVRALFFVGAILMLITFPIFNEVINASAVFVIFGIVLIILAGLTNRRLKLLFVIDGAVSLFLIILLEFMAQGLTFSDHPFLVSLNQFLALIFLVSLYYCLRTIRGFLFK